jgi:hypothetical protein
MLKFQPPTQMPSNEMDMSHQSLPKEIINRISLKILPFNSRLCIPLLSLYGDLQIYKSDNYTLYCDNLVIDKRMPSSAMSTMPHSKQATLSKQKKRKSDSRFITVMSDMRTANVKRLAKESYPLHIQHLIKIDALTSSRLDR